MFRKILFFLRNLTKMMIQNCILPFAYYLAKKRHPGKKTLYVFADAHHTSIPFSLQVMYEHVKKIGIEPICHFYDYTHEGNIKSLMHAIAFMDLLAQARYVFICDTFLPASSPNLDSDTKVVQLCHYSGPFKKIGYATEDDVPSYYKSNVFKNYALVTASSPMYVPLLAHAMKQKPHVVQPLGVSRSDVFFDQNWIKDCREAFYAKYPHAHGKKILLWSPTFRGKAASPDTLDNRQFIQLQKDLGDDWIVLIKHHPHDDMVAADDSCRSNCDIPSERLLPVVDLFITDYSTTVLDYLAFDKPFILYAPDLEEYERTRGFFIDYRQITKNLTTDPSQLHQMVLKVYRQWENGDLDDILHCKQRFTAACDGNATPRILEYLDQLDHI